MTEPASEPAIAEVSRPQELVRACARCAAAVAGAAMPEATVQSLARGFLVAARRGAEDVGCDQEADVANAVEFLACTAEVVPLDTAQAWFTARLGLLLELLQPSVRLSEEAGALLPMLGRGLSTLEESFRADEPRRESERAKARAAKERAEALALARVAEEQHRAAALRRSEPETPQPDPAATHEIPSHWVKSTDYEGEWVDARLHDEALAAKVHVRTGFPTFIVRRAGSRLTFQCALRWGGGTLAAKLMSGPEHSPRAAFDAVMKLFRAVPDEPLKQEASEVPWLWQVQRAIRARFPKNTPRVTAVEMFNTVAVGPPRYVCKITFFEPGQQQVHRSSTPWESLSAAFKEALARSLEFASETQVTLTRKRTLLERIADEGLSKGSLEYPPAPNERHLCRLRWQSLDGKTLTVTSEVSDSREEAFERALRLAVSREASRDLDWRSAVKTNLANMGIPAESVTVKFVEQLGEDTGKTFTCKVAWGLREAYMHNTQPCPTMRSAALAAIQGVEATLAKLKSTRTLSAAIKAGNAPNLNPQQSQQQMREMMTLLEGIRPRWLEERQRLLAKTARSVDESARLRDLSAYLALLDPARRGEIEPRAADTVIGQMLEEATSAVSSDCGRINTLDDLHFLRAISAGKVIKPGSPLMLTPEFKEACSSKGRALETVLSHLVDRRLVNRHEGNQLTMADAGFKLLLKYIGPRGMAGLSEKATERLAQLRSSLT